MALFMAKEPPRTSREKNAPAKFAAGKNVPKSDAAPERRFGMRRIGDLAPDVGRAAFRRFGFVQSSVVTRWTEIVGERYATVCQPDMIRFPQGTRADGTLHLTVESAAATMIQHVVPDIIARVNRFFGYAAVASVRLNHGRVVRQTQGPARPPPNIGPLPVELGDALRDIGDPELRAVLENLAAGISRSEGPPKIS
jgi:hypothetical protein